MKKCQVCNTYRTVAAFKPGVPGCRECDYGDPERTPTSKRCVTCGERKDFAAFTELKTGRFGKHSWCRECLRQYWRDRRAGEPTQERAPRLNETDSTCGIYEICHAPTNTRYIGASQDINRRFIAHRHRLKTGTHINKALQAAHDAGGMPSLAFNVVLECLPEELGNKERDTWHYWKAKGLLMGNPSTFRHTGFVRKNKA